MDTQYTNIVLQLSLFLTYHYQFECSNLSFFCQGGFGVLWFFGWTAVAHECPSEHPSITQEEKEHLCGAVATTPVRKVKKTIAKGFCENSQQQICLLS